MAKRIVNELKSCPFCGSNTAPEIMLASDAEMTDEGSPEYEFLSTHYIVVCNFNRGGCGAHSSVRNETPEEAAAAWNRRA